MPWSLAIPPFVVVVIVVVLVEEDGFPGILPGWFPIAGPVELLLECESIVLDEEELPPID